MESDIEFSQCHRDAATAVLDSSVSAAINADCGRAKARQEVPIGINSIGYHDGAVVLSRAACLEITLPDHQDDSMPSRRAGDGQGSGNNQDPATVERQK